MRLVGIVAWTTLFAMGCGGAKPSGPAWPAPSTTADDGGESLEPRTTTVAASVEKSADSAAPASTTAAESKSESPTAPADEKPSTSSQAPSVPVVDDILMTDDMIIEIED